MVSGLGQRQLPWVLSEAVTQRTLVEYGHILHKLYIFSQYNIDFSSA